MILCLALMGTAGAQKDGCDSWGVDHNSDWVILKTSAQVWPQYVIHYDPPSAVKWL